MNNDAKDVDLVECPICGQMFRKGVIEGHAVLCLDKYDQDQETDRATDSYKRPRFDIEEEVNFSSLMSTLDKGISTSQGRSLYLPVQNILTEPQKSRICEKSTKSLAMTNFFSPRRTSSKPNIALPAPETEGNGSSPKYNAINKTRDFKPLADQMRPRCLDDFVGQKHILAPACILRQLIDHNEFPSMILWGPPGCGKTSLAHVVATRCEKSRDFNFVALSATNSGVNDVKDVVKRAKNDTMLLKRKTVLFIDEIHRFNKLQQDIFLPHVENGTIILIGATTENPSFSLNSALLSRCRVFVLDKLNVDFILEILERAAKKIGFIIVESENQTQEKQTDKFIQSQALKILAEQCDGDARIALNCLSLAVQFETGKHSDKEMMDAKMPFVVTIEHIQDCLQRSHLLYDRKGDEHYNCISALHKSMRGGDGNAALYWLGRILEAGEDPRYVSRRLIRFASEDIGLADPFALHQAVSAHEACQFIGMPECDVVLAQCVVYLSEAPKSVRIYDAYKRVKDCIASHKGPLPGVPLHLRNAVTKLDKDLGYAKDYIYNPHYTGTEPINQIYLPKGLEDQKFLEPAN